MQKGLSIGIMKDLAQVGQERGIRFKDKYFYHEDMMCKIAGYWIPSTMHEIMTVLPRDLGALEDDVCSHYMTSTDDNCWIAGYMYMAEEKAPELVDALGKLLVWAIKEGWLG